MRVVHVCLSCFYIDGRSYQENELVQQHVNDGHDVLVIASTETHSTEGKIIYTKPGEYVGTDGARVIRLPYRSFLPHKLMAKLRMNVGTYAALWQFRPDAILFHGTCGWELRNVARYVRTHPEIPFYVDSHEDWNNSAKGFLSREGLHRFYYGMILRSVIPLVRKILCISTESIDFVSDLYRIPRSKLEFFPLGGRPIPEQEYQVRRNAMRKEYNLSDSNIMFIQSGKQTKRKKLLETLRAFAVCSNPRLRLIVAGVLNDEIKEEADHLILADTRVTYVGWKSTEELTNLLCAADIYLQPGTQSVTMQHSLCAHCAVVLDDVPAHQVYLRDNGWLINAGQPLESILNQLADVNLLEMQKQSFTIAADLLDYSVLSRRILS